MFTLLLSGPFWQPWNVAIAPNVQTPLTAPSVGAPQLVSKPALGVTSAGVSQPSAVELKPTGRKELPEVMAFLVLFLFQYFWGSG